MKSVSIFKARKSNQLLFVVLIAIVCSGCSTIQTHTGKGNQYKPYIGTSVAIDKAKKVWKNYDYYGQFELYAADIPASLIADTIIIPYDLYKYLRNNVGRENKELNENEL